MSVSSYLDIFLAGRKDISILKIAIIQALIDFGWTFNDCGIISYLPIGDDDNFNWQREDISVEALMAIFCEKEKREEIIGVAMTWKDTGIGGEFLFNENSVVSVSLIINRKRIGDSNKITDVNWYLVRLLPVFKSGSMMVESFAYDEHV